MAPDTPKLVLHLPASLFHITHYYYHYDLMTLLKNFCTRQWMGLRKSASNRAPHLVRPALTVCMCWSIIMWLSWFKNDCTVFRHITCKLTSDLLRSLILHLPFVLIASANVHEHVQTEIFCLRSKCNHLAFYFAICSNFRCDRGCNSDLSWWTWVTAQVPTWGLYVTSVFSKRCLSCRLASITRLVWDPTLGRFSG